MNSVTPKVLVGAITGALDGIWVDLMMLSVMVGCFSSL
jgi:hypothetical protein